jgi:predicted ATPase
MNMDALRDLMGELNRARKPSVDSKALEVLFSPPYRGTNNPKIVDYPKQLSGLHDKPSQSLNISGSTSGQAQNLSGFFGIPTGGSYIA